LKTKINLLCAALQVMGYGSYTLSLLITSYFVLYSIMFVKLYYWKYSGDWEPLVGQPWSRTWVSNPRPARLCYAAPGHICKLYICHKNSAI